MKLSYWFAIAVACCFALTAIFLKILIPKLKSHKMGQKILDIGPRWHKSKEGTPTMGGVSFVLAAALVCLGCYIVRLLTGGSMENAIPALLTFGYALFCAAIGFIDDYTKFIKKRNEGLTVLQKYGLQLIAAGVYLAGMKLLGCLQTTLYLPYFDKTVELGLFYYPIALLLLTGMANAVNLTDGIDGLAGSVTMVVGAFFGFVALCLENAGMTVLAGVLLGGCLGFLLYNFHPARVFMGDTGSLFLGGMVAGLAFLMENPLIMLVCGLIYVIETASVILQVVYFKLTHGKRLFKMSPIHHHFEKCGWSEVKIVAVFTIGTVVFCVAAYFGCGFPV